MAYMIWNYNGFLFIFSFASRSFNLLVCILNQTLFTPEFLKEAFKEALMCIVPSIIVPREARLINQSGRRPERSESRANSSEKYIYIHIYRGYYTAAQRYEFYFRVVKTIFYERAQRVSKILFLTRENKIHIFKPPCNFLFII